MPPGRLALVRWAVGAVLLILVGTGIGAARLWPAELGGLMHRVMQAGHALGATGWLMAFLAQTIIALCGILPASAGALAAGLAFGVVGGFCLSAAATLVGAVLAFLLARSLFRPVIARRLSRHTRLTQLDAAITADGWRLVALMRISPVMPFAATSYALGLTSLTMRAYLIGTLASMPALLGYVAMGRLAGSGLASLAAGGPSLWQWLALGVALLATALLTLRLARIIGPILRLPRQQTAPGPGRSKQPRLTKVKTAAAAPTRRTTTAVLLGCYALLLCARAPRIIITGRFWAEEGKVFFHNAWTMPPWTALFVSFGGYLNLPANAAALAARWLMPLELAPYLTIAVALVIHLIPPLLLLTARDAWLRPLWVRLGCVLILLLAPQVYEGLLQTLHCQFELALCCGLILALDTAPGWRRTVHLALLFLAPLCGLVAAATLPLFLLRALSDRSRARAVQALALAAGVAIQLAFFFHAVSGRGNGLHPLTALCVVTLRYLDAPFLGLRHAQALADMLRARLPYGHLPRLVLYLPFLAFGPLLLLTIRSRRRRPAFWLFAAGGAIAALTYLGALGGPLSLIDASGGERYVFVPQTLFALTLLSLTATSGGWTRRACALAVLWLIAIAAREYRHPWDVLSDGPPWRAEIAAWRADPTHIIQLWPPGWTMTLKPSDRWPH